MGANFTGFRYVRHVVLSHSSMGHTARPMGVHGSCINIGCDAHICKLNYRDNYLTVMRWEFGIRK